MEKFDIRNFLSENKLTDQSKQLDEEMTNYRALRDATVEFSTIKRDGMVQIFFDNGTILEFENNGNASILKRK